MRKINQYKTTYYKEMAALITLGFITFVWLCNLKNDESLVYVKQPAAVVVATTTPPVALPACVKAGTVEEVIAKHFPKNQCVMIAIAKAESHLKMTAKGYNCFYYKGIATTTPIKNGSRACQPKDRELAWSVDCFVLQSNQPAGVRECPKGITVDKHIEEMAELSKICGLHCWGAYTDGRYKQYLTQK